MPTFGDYSDSVLRTEIHTLHDSLIESSGLCRKGDLLSEILSTHDDVHGKDAAFAVYCSNGYVSAFIDRYFREIKLRDETNDEQMVLSAEWKYLQKEYVIERMELTTDTEGTARLAPVSMIVSINAMTDVEIERKASEHDAQASGHQNHARELRRFATDRRAQRSGE